jgi:ABC-2 type transport system ATP-binding protein
MIEARAVTQRYGPITAVDNLDLSVPQGVCFGLLGPNGAGKTTLIEIIEGILQPTAGQVFFQGQPRSTRFREKIGIMFQQTALLNYLTVQETLTAFHALYRDPAPVDEIMGLCRLDDIRSRYNDKISGGQRQRLLLALALINRPDLLFLDEPSTGLDPQARRHLWDIISQVKRSGKTIVLTTHYMEEAQQMCDQVAIMDHGRIIAQGSPEQLIRQHTHGITITLSSDGLNPTAGALPFEMKRIEDRLVVQVEDTNRAIAAFLEQGVDLSTMSVQMPSLESVFLNLTGRRLRE